VSALAFSSPQDMGSIVQNKTMHLVTASVDTRIRIFNLVEGASTSSGGGKPEAVLEGHTSVPRGLDVSLDGRWLVSGGRDSVVLIWDLFSSSSTKEKEKKKKNNRKTPTLVKTIPILERVEALGLLRLDDNQFHSKTEFDQIRFYTGGEKGIIKIWDGSKGHVVQKLGEEQTQSSAELEEQRQIVDVL
jgi:U3 small nucleolar RNA-associated protein 13